MQGISEISGCFMWPFFGAYIHHTSMYRTQKQAAAARAGQDSWPVLVLVCKHTGKDDAHFCPETHEKQELVGERKHAPSRASQNAGKHRGKPTRAVGWGAEEQRGISLKLLSVVQDKRGLVLRNVPPSVVCVEHYFHQ